MKPSTPAETAFLAELAALMDRHGVMLFGSDDYDSSEAFVGTTFHVVSRTQPTTINLTLSEISDAIP
jgi:hypothetical protein